MSASSYIHANALIVGDAGLLLRGPSRSGKSTLTRELIDLAQAQGQFARLVGDDRVAVEAQGGRLIARPHPVIAGMIEARGVGILHVPHQAECVVRVVIDLLRRGMTAQGDADSAATSAVISGVALPRKVESIFDGAAAPRILSYIQQLMANSP